MTRHLLPQGRFSSASTSTTAGRSFQLSLLSAAVALCLGLAGHDAHALALGRINILSALGEPLRAQIDVTEISATEAEGLRVSIASQEAFRQAGVPYNSALADVRVRLDRRADGRYVVNLSGTRSMNDPFIDLLLDATWNAGRIVRDYTVLLDPPAARVVAAPVAPVPAQTQVAPPRRAAAPAPVVVAPPAARRVRPAEPPAPADAPVRTGSGSPAGSGEQVTVRPGDTASKIAGTYKPADVSLDQMLVALLQANPDAFIRGNINRMKSGAVLDLPSAAQASALSPSDATRSVRAQSQDFGSYRRRLAENAPATQTGAAERQASGRLQASVEERSAAAASPDKLRLSQGAAATEDKLAQARQAQAANSRVAELSKNLSDLNRLQAASGSAGAAAGTTTATTPTATPPASTRPATPATAAPATGSAPTVTAPSAASVTPPVAAPAPAAATPSAAGTTGSTTSAASSSPATPTPSAAPPSTPPAVGAAVVPPAAVASSAANNTVVVAPSAANAPGTVASPAAVPPAATASAVARPPAARPAAVPVAERGFFADLLDNPLMLAAAAIIAALLAFLLVRVLRKRRADSPDSVFLESKMPRDSFFGVSGGQQVDTTDRASSVASSLSYSPSQLDTGDVDPVAEADVYLAYGRDLQAEEILREAMRTNPDRAAIPLKLLEIHAKRRDARAFEALATDLQKMTGGTGSEWLRAVELGRELDPGNPLYQTGAVDNAVTVPVAASKSAAAVVPVAVPVAVEPVAPPPAFVPSVAPLDFDLELSRPSPLSAPVSASLPPAPSAAPVSRPIEPHTNFATTMSEAPRTTMEPTLGGGPRLPADSRSMDFDSDPDTSPAPLEPTTRAGLLSEDRTQPATLHGNLARESGFIEFDMASLSQRDVLPDTGPAPLDGGDAGGEDAHAIKLSLARELQALGDNEGARSLVDEVEAEATGDVKERARQLRAQLA